VQWFTSYRAQREKTQTKTILSTATADSNNTTPLMKNTAIVYYSVLCCLVGKHPASKMSCTKNSQKFTSSWLKQKSNVAAVACQVITLPIYHRELVSQNFDKVPA